MTDPAFYEETDDPRRLASRVADLLGRTLRGWRDLRPSPLGLLSTLASLRIGVPDVFALHAALSPDRLALADDSRRLTYADAAAAIDAVADLFARLGVGRGRAVALAAENSVDYVIAWFAALRAGARIVHASFESTPDELAYMVDHGGVAAVVVSERSVDAAVRARAGRSLALVASGTLEDPRCDAHIARPGARRRRLLPRLRALRRDAENVVYTSGTTGRPKGAVRDLQGSGIGELLRIVERLPVAGADHQLVVGRLYHSGAQAFTILGAALGHTLYIERRFDPERLLAKLDAERIEVMFLVPTMLRRLLDHIDTTGRRAVPGAPLRALVCGAAEFPHALRVRACAFFGSHRVYDFYGATELGWITLIRGDEMMERPRSVGRPLAGQAIALVDCERSRIDGVERDVGVIRARSGHAMRGYLADAAATSSAQSDGWTTVEDTGYLDADGYLYLAGRRRDMIITGGENVYPAEVEDVLARAEGVAEIAVVGVPDSEWGERVVAFVVARDPADAPERLAVWAREHLAPAKRPREWVVCDELPRNPTGKVLKTELRARISSR